MRVWLVEVTEYHILCVHDAHAPHVLLGYLGYLLIIQFLLIIR
jgi:hypothetical protein